MRFFSLKNGFLALLAAAALLCSDRVHASSSHLSKSDRLLRTDAIQQSIDVIGTFALKFSAALRAPSGSDEQAARALELLELLTKDFQITFYSGPSIYIEANDYQSLLILLETLSLNIPFHSTLIGNFSVENYFHDKCSKRRYVDLQTLEYVMQTNTSGFSSLIAALDQLRVIEIKPDVFKIQIVEARPIGGISIPPIMP